MAWGFGCCAPEASVGIGRDPGETRILRIRRRKALAPAPSPEKSPPYDSKRSARTSRPRDLRLFTPNQNPKKGATLDWMVTSKSLKRSKMQTIYAIILGVLVLPGAFRVWNWGNKLWQLVRPAMRQCRNKQMPRWIPLSNWREADYRMVKV